MDNRTKMSERQLYSARQKPVATRGTPGCRAYTTEQRALLRVVAKAVRAVCGAEPAASTDSGLQEDQGIPGDPARFVHLAQQHRVVGLAAEGERLGTTLPQGSAERLHAVHNAEVSRSVALAVELVRLVRLLNDAGIQAVPIKGPVLGHRLYSSMARRSFWDLDLLLHREAILSAKELLLSEGYQREADWSPRREKRELRRNCEYNFDHPDSGIHVELHWRFLDRTIGFDLPMVDVWSRLESITFLGQPFWVLSWVDEMLALIVHNGAKHGWQRLRTIADVAVFGGRSTPEQTCRFMTTAEAVGVRRTIATGVILAADLLDAQMPELISWAEQDRRAAALSRFFSSELFRFDIDRKRDGLRATRAYLMMRERAVDRLRYLPRIARSVLAPTDREQEIVPLPRALRGLHVVLRPFRLAVKYLGRLCVRRHSSG